MTADPVVIEHLSKTFGADRGVADVSLVVEPCQVFGFLGPNGSGKSTTIRCLLGLYRPSRGRCRVFGHDTAAGSASFLAEVGYLPGELRLPERLTGAQVLATFRRMRRRHDTEYGDELVQRLGAVLDRPVGALSKGNKQKLGLVLAFMHRPRLLVLDEPTSGLDPLVQDEFAPLLRETVADGRTVLLSSHDLDEVQRVVQHVAIIRSGRIVVDDTVAALRAAAPRTIDLTFDHDVDASPLASVPGVSLHVNTPRQVNLTHTGAAGPVLTAIAALLPDTITARPADLEKLFLQLYGKDSDAH
ncbi:ABC transporter ATP-binding protein [Dermatophilaceae bacterium Soc4.6]